MANDGKYIDGVRWPKAIKPCTECGEVPEVWRVYPEVRGSQRHAVRCANCKREVHDKSRARTIRRWNRSNGGDGEGKLIEGDDYKWVDVGGEADA